MTRQGTYQNNGFGLTSTGAAALTWLNTVCHLTGHTLVESTLFQRHFIEMMLNQRGIDIELTSVPSGMAPAVPSHYR